MATVTTIKVKARGRKKDKKGEKKGEKEEMVVVLLLLLLKMVLKEVKEETKKRVLSAGKRQRSRYANFKVNKKQDAEIPSKTYNLLIVNI